MRNLIQSISLVLIFLLGNEIAAQDFTLSGEIRPRAEYSHGFRTLANTNQKASFFVSQRTRLNLDFSIDKTFRTYICIQDVRTWGSQRQLVGNQANAISLHEGWGEVYLGKNKYGAIKFGRQEIIYDDHRIFGNVGWAQQARSHDAILFKYINPKITIHAGLAYNQDKPTYVGSLYTVPGSYKTMQHLWLNKSFADNKLQASLLFLNLGMQTTKEDTAGNRENKVRFNQTAGTHIKGQFGSFGFAINGYMQFGETATFDDPNRIFAYLASVDLSYKIGKGITSVVGYEVISGNSQTETDPSYFATQHAFAPFFGTNHKFNGFMDYFYVGNHAGNVGLQDAYVKLKYKHDKFNIGGDVHLFLTGNDLADPTSLSMETASAYLGTEIDLYGGFSIVKGVTCVMGYSHLIPSESMQFLKGGDKSEYQNWGYTMLIIKPTFFSVSKKNK